MSGPPDLQNSALSALWELGSATVHDVHARIGQPRGLAYTTIATVMDRLFDKGAVTRRREGRSFVYRPVGERAGFDRARAEVAVATLLAPIERSAIASLVEVLADVDPRLLDELERAVAERRRGPGGP